MTSPSAPLRLLGAPASPYSRKMRALLRYRRIPFHWIQRGSRFDRGLPEPPVPLIPVLVLPAAGGGPDEATIDSTLQIRRLERDFAERRVLPPDPALAFLDFLIEDFADEWLTKAMFHYRWSFPPDVAKAAAVLPRYRQLEGPAAGVEAASRAFVERQVGRRALVGITDATRPTIEASYDATLRALDAVLDARPFVMGRRPGSADFGLFGQLSQLVLFDPTSAARALEVAPRLVAWCQWMEDLSGIEVGPTDWLSPDEAAEALRPLIELVGRYYAPFLLANADALARGADEVSARIDGRPWTQRPFPYQGKCLRWLREARAALGAEEGRRVDAALHRTGADALFAD